LINKILNNK